MAVSFLETYCFGQSCTSGKAGGLICEPLKAVWPATPARFLFEHLQLIESTIFFLLLSDVISHLRLGPPHRRHVIAPRPKIQPNKVLRPIHKSSCNRYRTLPLDVPHHPGYRILRRDRQHHVEHDRPSDAPPPPRSLSVVLTPA